MSTRNVFNKNGTVSPYGLALGYVDRVTRETESGKFVNFDIAARGDEYSVDVYYVGEDRERMDDGRTSGWFQTTSLTEARRIRAKALRMPDTGRAMASVWINWYAMGARK